MDIFVCHNLFFLIDSTVFHQDAPHSTMLDMYRRKRKDWENFKK